MTGNSGACLESCGTGFQPVSLPINYPRPLGVLFGAVGPVKADWNAA